MRWRERRCELGAGHDGAHRRGHYRWLDAKTGLGGFADFNRHCEAYGIGEDEAPAAFAAWLDRRRSDRGR